MLSFFKKLKGVIGSYRFAKELQDVCLTRKCLLSSFISFYLLLSSSIHYYEVLRFSAIHRSVELFHQPLLLFGYGHVAVVQFDGIVSLAQW